MKLRTLILFGTAAVILLVLSLIGLSYFPVQISPVTPLPDPIVVSYRDQRTTGHDVSISSADPEYQAIAALFAHPGRARFVDPVDYMGQIWIDTPTLRIAFIGDSLILFQQKGSSVGWSNNSRGLTQEDHVILQLLRARCEKDAGPAFKPYWVR